MVHIERERESMPFARFPDAVVQPVEQLSTSIEAIATQSDLAKLATSGERQADPRLKRIMYYLAEARAGGADLSDMIERGQKENGSYGTPRAPLVRTSLLRNLKLCDGLGLLTSPNLKELKSGCDPIVTHGPYTGETLQVDHIVPWAVCPWLNCELANLELLLGGLNMHHVMVSSCMKPQIKPDV